MQQVSGADRPPLDPAARGATPYRIVSPLLLASAGSMVAAALLATFIGAAVGTGPAQPDGAADAERLLRFADREDGAVIVADAAGQVLDVVTGQQGFLRGTLSGLTRIRRTEGIGQDPPFRLAALAGGRLVLTDTATGKTVELGAFGPTNAAVFARMLTLAPGPPAAMAQGPGNGAH